MIYGHQKRYFRIYNCIKEFDKDLEIFLANMRGDDVLFTQLIMAVIRDIKELTIRVSLYRFWVTVNAGNRA